MSNVFEFVAEHRNGAGKSEARRIRRAGGVPAIIYGHGEPQMLSLVTFKTAEYTSSCDKCFSTSL